MSKNITTLAELEIEQEKLKMLMEVTRQEFARNLGTNRKELKNYLMNKVVIPAGAIGLGVAAVNKMAATKEKNKKYSKSSDNDFWKMLLPLGVNIFQTYFLQKQTEKIENIATSENETIASSPNLRTVA